MSNQQESQLISGAQPSAEALERRFWDDEDKEGHGIVSGVEPSTEELERRFEEQHAKTAHGSSDGKPDPEIGQSPDNSEHRAKKCPW